MLRLVALLLFFSCTMIYAKEKGDDWEKPLALMRVAKDKLESVNGYSCRYKREEWIDGTLKTSTCKLTIRHNPFYVHMDEGSRQVTYDGGTTMYVKEGFFGLNVGLDEGIKRRLARHTILDIGMMNTVKKYGGAWLKESKLNDTMVMVDGNRVTCIHVGPNAKKYQYLQVKVWFDKDGFPYKTENYDFDGRVVERYTYSQIRVN